MEEHGTKWSLIATFFPGRTDNFIMKQYLKWMKKKNPSSPSKASKKTVPTKKRGRPPKEKVSKEPIQPSIAKRPRGRPKKNP